MKSFYITIIILLSFNINFAQRVVNHSLTNFALNSSTNKFSFDIYSQSIGAQSVRVGLTSYYIDFNNSALSTPILSNVNPKYTSGSPTGDYDAMTAQISLGKIAVTIVFTGNRDGTGDLLSTTSPNGELIATVILDIINSNATSMISWDAINSAMNTPTNQVLINNFQGSYDAPLPVELTSFSATLNQDKINLEWETKTEVNNCRFDIERKINEDEWNTLGFINGYGTTAEPKKYSYCDKDIYAGGTKFLYRLKQIDNNGKFEYSEVVEVEVVPTKFELSQNYPNPFNPTTTIQFSLPKQLQMKLNLYNILGALVDTIAEGNYEAGIYKINFNASNLPSGVYIYRIESNEFVQGKKMMLLK